MTTPPASQPDLESVRDHVRGMFRKNVETYDQAMPVLFAFHDNTVDIVAMYGDPKDCLAQMVEDGVRLDCGILCAETWSTFLDKDHRIDGMMEAASIFTFTPQSCVVEQMPFLRRSVGDVEWRDAQIESHQFADGALFRSMRALLGI